MPPPPIKWAAQLSAVQEVTLHGHADLPYWTAHLAPEHLTPTSENNRAHLLLIAASARFHGVGFRELSLSVAVTPPPGSEFPDAVYLLRAYNSNRFFAWCERTFFHTPYFHADVRLSTSPAAIALLHHGRPLLRAEMNPTPSTPRPPAYRAPAGFTGVVHLPRRSPTSPQRQFIANIAGDTETHPFLPTDTFSLNPSRDDNANVLQSLLDSHFTPTHWELRPNATHAKSKTYSTASPLPVMTSDE